MNIALVDDMPKEIIRLSGIIEEYATEHQLPVELQTFDSAEALLTSYHPLQYTLIFMDIYMDFIDTFESDTCVLHGGFRLPISVREQKKLDQIRRNYVFTKLHNKKRNRGGSR